MERADDFDYELPPELIAQQPLERRTDARLMVVHRAEESIEHYHVRDLPNILNAPDLLVLNDTRVLPARLIGIREQTKGRWQGLFLSEDEGGAWRLLAKTRGKIRPGETVMLVDRKANEHTRIKLVESLGGGEWRALPETAVSAHDLLGFIGRVPLPHYIRQGEMLPEDVENYQTVYARHPGSIAAPTAGLHLTPELLHALDERGIHHAFVTLHVGVGTFRPITSEYVDEHEMHSEYGVVSCETMELAQRTRREGGLIVAVGSTTTRLLESAGGPEGLRAFSGTTSLFVRPPYSFRIVDALLTNFHLPRSTLLVLVRTFAGSELMRRAYELAIRESYRFFSYGDAMLIL